METPGDALPFLSSPTNLTDIVRRLERDRFLNRHAGSLFPMGIVVPTRGRILDCACRSGGWMLDVAHLLPNASLSGIDSDAQMIKHAQLYARAESLSNCQFFVIDGTKNWPFDPAWFDFANARLLADDLRPHEWPGFLQECFRVLRPGGVLCLTEYETSVSNSAGFEQIQRLYHRTRFLLKQSFSPSGESNGVTAYLNRLLRQTGCIVTGTRSFAIDVSHGSEGYQSHLEEFCLRYSSMLPLIETTLDMPRSEVEQLYQRTTLEMSQKDFSCLQYYLSVWGNKPYVF